MDAPPSPDPRHGHDHAANALLGAVAVLCVACLAYGPLPIALGGMAAVLSGAAALALAAGFYRHVRPRPQFWVTCTALTHVVLFSALGVLLSYLLARSSVPFRDDWLHRADRALGFDWLAYARAIDSRPALAHLYNFAYPSLIPQTVVAVLALGFGGRLAQLRIMALAAILCGTLAVLLSAAFPAIGQAVMLGLSSENFAIINLDAAIVHVPDMTALRDGTAASFDFRAAEGIITFPSYHAGLSGVLFWAFLQCRPAAVRWAGAALAAATIAATPVNGGHYLVDVLAGLALAGPQIMAIPPFTCSVCPVT